MKNREVEEIDLSEFKILQTLKLSYRDSVWSGDKPVVNVSPKTISFNKASEKLLCLRDGVRVAFAIRNGYTYVAALPHDCKIRGLMLKKQGGATTYRALILPFMRESLPLDFLGYWELVDSVFAGGIDWFELVKYE